MEFGIKGKRALVLASSKGLGRGVAQALSAEGAEVTITGRDAAALEAVAHEITAQTSHPAAFIAADLSARDCASELWRQVVEKNGDIDILVNNCGGPPPGTAREMTGQQVLAHSQAMVATIIDLTQKALPGMAAKGWGRILTLASSGVEQPIPNLALSNTLRSALSGWSKSLAAEIAADGITCNMLLPGRIDTARTRQIDEANAKRLGKTVQEIRQASHATIPMGRYGTVEEYSNIACFLCSDHAGYITGSKVRCDGGMIRGA